MCDNEELPKSVKCVIYCSLIPETTYSKIDRTFQVPQLNKTTRKASLCFSVSKMFAFLGFLVLVAGIRANTEEAILIQNLQEALQELSETQNLELLNETLKQLQVPQLFRSTDNVDYDYTITQTLEANTVCSLCYTVANFLIDERRNNVSLDIIALEAGAVCTLGGIETAAVCKGVIDLNLPILGYIIDHNPEVTGERVCDLLLQKSGCSSTTFEWTIDVPEGTTVPRKSPSNPESTFNVLHISDFHYDPLYTPGRAVACKEPLCCQIDQEDSEDSDGSVCGFWAEYNNVDSSEALVDEAIRKASEFGFEYVYFTGDIVSHRVWGTSVENNTRDLKLVFGKMKAAFGGKPIYPIIGNHEPNPVNEFAPEDVLDSSLSSEWLYRLIASEFSEWLPGSEEDLLNGGYYSASPREGLRIVGLNSNLAYLENWWLIQNDTDPGGQLAWLANTLKEAEDNGEVVHILSHIPGGKSDLLPVWSREYHKIIERFSNTVAAQFNGHTHKDQFTVQFGSSNTSEAINVAINGASVICDKSNPSFKIINIDTNNFDVIDTHEYTFNLTEANLDPEITPNWYKLYSFRDSYQVNSLAPAELGELVSKMVADHTLLDAYHIFRYRNADQALESGCDDSCKKNYLCEIVTSRVGDSTQCDLFTELYNNHV